MAESVRVDDADDDAVAVVAILPRDNVELGAAAAGVVLSSVPSLRPHSPSECLAGRPASADYSPLGHFHRCFGSAHDLAPLDTYSCVLHFPLGRHFVG